MSSNSASSLSIISQLASSQNRRDEKPNQALAKQIVAENNKQAVSILIESLTKKGKDIQSDCIKVLYEIGEQKPRLIASHVNDFVALLDNKNNRLQWGAMIALDAIATENPKVIYTTLAKIINVADKGSVITKDHAVNILIKLCAEKQYADNAFTLLIEQLKSAPANQLPKYAEEAVPIINNKNKILFIKTLLSRLDDIEKDTKRKRVEKAIKKLS